MSGSMALPQPDSVMMSMSPLKAVQMPRVWVITWRHDGVWGPHYHWGHTNLSDLCSYLGPWSHPGMVLLQLGLRWCLWPVLPLGAIEELTPDAWVLESWSLPLPATSARDLLPYPPSNLPQCCGHRRASPNFWSSWENCFPFSGWPHMKDSWPHPSPCAQES